MKMVSGKLIAYDTFGNELECRQYSGVTKKERVMNLYITDYGDRLGAIGLIPDTDDTMIHLDGTNKKHWAEKRTYRKDEPLRFPEQHGIKTNSRKKSNKYLKTYKVNAVAGRHTN